MAVLTAAGIDCSNGTLNGQFATTTAASSTYPIGAYVMVLAVGCFARIALNSSTTIWLNNAGATSGFFQRGNPGGAGATTLAGTWRCRGSTSNAVADQFFQRFA